MSELNREIHDAMGCTFVTLVTPPGWGQYPYPYLQCQTHKGHKFLELPDYEHDLNASMEVIREKWPDCYSVTLSDDCTVLGVPHGEWQLPWNDDTDAARLAHALKEALSE